LNVLKVEVLNSFEELLKLNGGHPEKLFKEKAKTDGYDDVAMHVGL
jgi:hypothetical protein